MKSPARKSHSSQSTERSVGRNRLETGGAVVGALEREAGGVAGLGVVGREDREVADHADARGRDGEAGVDIVEVEVLGAPGVVDGVGVGVCARAVRFVVTARAIDESRNNLNRFIVYLRSCGVERQVIRTWYALTSKKAIRLALPLKLQPKG